MSRLLKNCARHLSQRRWVRLAVISIINYFLDLNQFSGGWENSFFNEASMSCSFRSSRFKRQQVSLPDGMNYLQNYCIVFMYFCMNLDLVIIQMNIKIHSKNSIALVKYFELLLVRDLKRNLTDEAQHVLRPAHEKFVFYFLLAAALFPPLLKLAT